MGKGFILDKQYLIGRDLKTLPIRYGNLKRCCIDDVAVSGLFINYLFPGIIDL
jgi:hypothetical protein